MHPDRTRSNCRSLVQVDPRGKGLVKPARKRLKPAVLERLTEKHRLVLSHLVFGGGFGKPMSIEETAERLRVRRRYIRDLLADPLFIAEYRRMIEVARLLLAPRALHRLRDLLDWQGQGKAADARVRLKAAIVILDGSA
jgi:hypothetical protein